jgi:hypothetical protein
MALLRQCLQAVRTKHHEWDAQDAAWPETVPVQCFEPASAHALPWPSQPGAMAVPAAMLRIAVARQAFHPAGIR